MAKSKVLKELANNEITLDVALRRLLLICNDLNYIELSTWAEKELNGYSDNEDVPEYRNLGVGQLLYSGLRGTVGTHLKITNNPLPILWIPKEYIDLICNNYERRTIGVIIDRANGNSQYSADLTSLRSVINVGIAFTSIIHKFDSSHYAEIANKVSNILLKIFMKLDKEYGNLDELDVDTSGKTEEHIKAFEQQLIIEIGEIKVINIGDDNTFKNTDVGVETK